MPRVTLFRSADGQGHRSTPWFGPVTTPGVLLHAALVATGWLYILKQRIVGLLASLLACLYVITHVCTKVCMYVCLCVCVYACMYRCMDV